MAPNESDYRARDEYIAERLSHYGGELECDAAGSIRRLWAEKDRLSAEIEKVRSKLAAAPCWCNDCAHGYAEDEGIICFSPDSEHAADYMGTYDSCEHCALHPALCGPSKEETP